MLDTSCSINIIFLLTLDVIGIPRDKIVRQPMEVSSFRGHKTFTIGFVNLVLTVGPIRVAHPFQAIDLCMSYHVLLGRSWIHRNKTVPSTYHQWKRIHINATESSFQREGKVAPARPWGSPLLEWKELEGGEPPVGNSGFTLVGRPRKGRQDKQSNNRSRRENDRLRKVRLADGGTCLPFMMFCGIRFSCGIWTP